jgi:hypothetical protein
VERTLLHARACDGGITASDGVTPCNYDNPGVIGKLLARWQRFYRNRILWKNNDVHFAAGGKGKYGFDLSFDMLNSK